MWCALRQVPCPLDDPYATRGVIANLAALWANAQATGATRLIVARVVETREGPKGLLAATLNAAALEDAVVDNDDRLVAEFAAEVLTIWNTGLTALVPGR